MMSWTYELSLENRANVEAILTHASVMLSLGAVYNSAEILEIGRILAPGEMWRVQRTAVFKLCEFRRDRSPAIAALVTPNSPKGATWEFWGHWADGTELYLLTEARPS